MRDYSTNVLPRRDPRGIHGYLGFEFELVAKAPNGSGFENAADCLRGVAKVVTSDGSVRNGHGEGAEAKVLVWCDRAALTVRALCERLRIANVAEVNHTCGLHVHLDARGLPAGRANGFAGAMMRARNDWMQLIPTARRSNTYVNASDDVCDRYAFVNVRSTTVEFRLHPGTMNPHKAYGWACVCGDLLHLLRSDTEGVAELPEQIGPQSECFGADAREYIAARQHNHGSM